MSALHRGLLAALRGDPALDRATRAALDPTATPASLAIVGPAELRPFAVGLLASAEHADRTVLAVVATTREADDLAQALACVVPAASVAVLPAWETLPHERLSPRADTVGRRLAVLRRLAHPDEGDGPIRVLVAPVRALLQPFVRGLGEVSPVAFAAGDDIDLDDVVARLVAAGYQRTDLVERRGDIAVRGGILDVFPPTAEHPVRVELWGDTVEEIRAFTVADQRSISTSEPLPSLWAPACRELLLSDAVRARAAALAEEHPALADVLDAVAEGRAVEGMEALAPVLADGMETLLDVVPRSTMVVVGDPERVRARAHDLLATAAEFTAASWLVAAEGGRVPIDLDGAALRDLDTIVDQAHDYGLPWWTVTPFAAEPGDDDAVAPAVHVLPEFRGDTEALLTWVRGRASDGWSIVLMTEGHGPAERMVEVLTQADVPARDPRS